MQICDHQVPPPADLILMPGRAVRLYNQQPIPFGKFMKQFPSSLPSFNSISTSQMVSVADESREQEPLLGSPGETTQKQDAHIAWNLITGPY